MKTSRILIAVACFSIIFALFSGVGYALEQDELNVSLAWSNQTPQPGNAVTISMFCTSSSSEELTIYYIGINFDWMDPDRFVGFDLLDNPVSIPSFGTHAFDSLLVTIPADVSVGSHSYFVGMEGVEGEANDFSWDSQTLMLTIQDPAEDEYTELLAEVTSSITAADKVSYQSPEAQSLLQQAETAYNQALSLADQENWDDAIVALENAFDYLEEAELEEQNYEPESQQDDMIIIVGSAVVVIVAVLLIIVMLRRNKKQAPNDQTTEE